MQYKSLWIEASAKCKCKSNLNIPPHLWTDYVKKVPNYRYKNGIVRVQLQSSLSKLVQANGTAMERTGNELLWLTAS